ncbi:hypothetical protein H8959_014215 [Pygathrix nigripes]
MLVTQDVQLGLFMAVMPTLIQAGASASSSLRIRFHLELTRIEPLSILMFLEGASADEPRTVPVEVTELLDVSMELGCFLAGALVSSQGPMVTEEIAASIEPIRDFLAIVFFASIGLHVFPTFVVYELTVLVFLTLSVVVMKFLLAVLVLSLILPRSSQYIKWIVSAGLAQVSEFSFVLGSRARRAGVISREVYLLILSVTTLSLLLAPVLWKAAIMRPSTFLSDPQSLFSDPQTPSGPETLPSDPPKRPTGLPLRRSPQTHRPSPQTLRCFPQILRPSSQTHGPSPQIHRPSLHTFPSDLEVGRASASVDHGAIFPCSTAVTLVFRGRLSVRVGFRQGPRPFRCALLNPSRLRPDWNYLRCVSLVCACRQDLFCPQSVWSELAQTFPLSVHGRGWWSLQRDLQVPGAQRPA